VRSSPPPFVVAALPLGASSCSRGRHLLPAPNPFFCRSSRSSRERAEQRTHFFPSPSGAVVCPSFSAPPSSAAAVARRGLLVPVRAPPVAAAPYLRHGSRRRLLGPDPALPEPDPPRGGWISAMAARRRSSGRLAPRLHVLAARRGRARLLSPLVAAARPSALSARPSSLRLSAGGALLCVRPLFCSTQEGGGFALLAQEGGGVLCFALHL